MGIDLEAYLKRIGVPALPAAGTDALAQIQAAHLLAVPFENLDIVPLGRTISLDAESLFDKIVRRQRGGFCYELNGLLAEALRALGFAVDLASASWPEDGGGFGPAFDHLVLIARVPGDAERWLVDVAAGRHSFEWPLPLRPDHEVTHEETKRSYRMEQRNDRIWRIHVREDGGAWRPQYELDAGPFPLEAFFERCAYHNWSPESVFTQGTLCSLALSGGRVTISQGRLIITRDGERTETDLDGEAGERDALRTWFGIDLVDEQD